MFKVYTDDEAAGESTIRRVFAKCYAEEFIFKAKLDEGDLKAKMKRIRKCHD